MNIIAAERVRLNMSQTDLANELGTYRNKVANWEKYPCSMSVDDAQKLAHLFNCSIDYLVGLSSDRGGTQ